MKFSILTNSELIPSSTKIFHLEKQDFWNKLSYYEKESILEVIQDIEMNKTVPFNNFLAKQIN